MKSAATAQPHAQLATPHAQLATPRDQVAEREDQHADHQQGDTDRIQRHRANQEDQQRKHPKAQQSMGRGSLRHTPRREINGTKRPSPQSTGCAGEEYRDQHIQRPTAKGLRQRRRDRFVNPVIQPHAEHCPEKHHDDKRQG